MDGPIGHEDHEATRLLRRAAAGDGDAVGALMPLVYEELRRLADRELRRERAGHTLQATVLVHEAFLKLIGQDRIDLADRRHFFAVASNLIRQILVDHARTRGRRKRGGDWQRVPLEGLPVDDTGPGIDFVELDDALGDLARLDDRCARVVELRYFGGLSVEEVAETLQVSPRTVANDWRTAKAWLHDRLARHA